MEGMAETSYTHLRENLAAVLDKVVDDREVVLVRRKGARDVALVPADELAGLMETAHLLRSPANARRLMSALRGKGKRMSIGDVRREVGIGPAH
jgi:antitoxin YefM